MGNSRVFRIHSGGDLDAAYALSQDLLGHAAPGCRTEVMLRADVRSDRDLRRFLPVGPGLQLYLDLPRELHSAVEPALSAIIERDSGRYVLRPLSAELVALLERLPGMPAQLSATDVPLPSELPALFLAAVADASASITWHTCWPGERDGAGVELGINGARMWHRDTPPQHSVYVHVHPAEPELAGRLAEAVGGRVLGGAATGW